MEVCEVDSSGLKQEDLAGFRVKGNEPSVSIKLWEFGNSLMT
jgi:hypothetical protein